MKIAVIGAGLIGVSTAYFLRRRGHDVTVIDRAEGPARETSFANGGLLTPSMADPWNAPGCWRVLLTSLMRSDAALQLRARALPSMLGWGVKFLLNSQQARFQRNTLNNLRLALYSLRMMESLRQEAPLEYGRSTSGTLKLYRDSASLDAATELSRRIVPEGLRVRRLSAAETIEIEPALASIEHQVAGALHFPDDESGDAYRFSTALASNAEKLGVEFRFGTSVSSIEMRSGAVTAVVSDRERFVADRYVVCAGSYSTPLLRQVGMGLPVRPAKGYSVTFDAGHVKPMLRVPLVDDHYHAALVPLDGALRVVGTAEFAGYDRSANPRRIGNLIALLKQLLPQAQFNPDAARPWCGLRPMSADGVPIIGPTAIPNLLVNTGHGHLGWTMAAGSGALLADLLSANAPSIDPAPFAPARFLRRA
jgi:D-amino-acid dehydrogenase